MRGFSLPKTLMRIAELSGGVLPTTSSPTVPTVMVKLVVSFFDSELKKFYSRTWETSWLEIPPEHLHDRENITCNFDTDLFFHSKLYGGRWMLVVEPSCALFFPGASTTATSEVSCGWCLIKPFQNIGGNVGDRSGRLQHNSLPLPDLADYHTGAQEEKVCLPVRVSPDARPNRLSMHLVGAASPAFRGLASCTATFAYDIF